MSLLDIFEDLDALYEAYEANYKSPYLALADSEITAAKAAYKNKLIFPSYINDQGKVQQTGNYVTTGPYYILDLDAFHKAYDKDFNRLGLLGAFNTKGELPRGGWSVIRNIKDENIKKQEEAYKRLKELWVLLYSSDTRGILFDNWCDIDIYRRFIKSPAEFEKLVQEAVNKFEAGHKANEDKHNNLYIELSDRLELALKKVNQKLLDKLSFFMDDESYLPIINMTEDARLRKVAGLPVKFHYSLDLGDFTRVALYPSEHLDEYTVEWFKNTLEEKLSSPDLDIKTAERKSGLEEVKFKFKNPHIDATVDCFFIDTETDELYHCNLDFKVKDKTNSEITTGQLLKSQLIFAHYYCPQVGFKRNYTTYSMGECSTLTRSIYSWAQDCEDISQIAIRLPEAVNYGPGTEKEDYIGAVGDFEECSSVDDDKLWHRGIEYDGIDKWAVLDVAEVHFLTPALQAKYAEPKEWNYIVQRVKQESHVHSDWKVKLK